MKLKFLVYSICSLISSTTLAQSVLPTEPSNAPIKTEADSVNPAIHVDIKLSINQKRIDIAEYMTRASKGNQHTAHLAVPLKMLNVVGKSDGSLVVILTVNNIRGTTGDVNGRVGDLEIYANIKYPDSFCGNPTFLKHIRDFKLSEGVNPLSEDISIDSNSKAKLEFFIHNFH